MTVTEVGATLREYTVDGAPIVDGFAVDAMPDGGRGQPLLPWPNRIADGHYAWDEHELQLPLDEVSRRNASHGLTRWLNWQCAEQSENALSLELMLHPRPGYPFTLALRVQYRLAEQGLTVTTQATNRGERALPYGVGFHPYFSVGTALVDEALLQVPARKVLELDERMIPTGAQRDVSGTDLDFRQARPIGAQRIDSCFTWLERNEAQLRAPDGSVIVTLWMDEAFKYLQVFTGDSLAPERKRQGVAIEPMTCPPNAFRSSQDVLRLEPAQSHTCVWGVTLTTR